MNLLGGDANESPQESKVLLTIIGKEAAIDGKLEISESIIVDCYVSGSLIVEGKLTIQSNGFVNADVKTTDAEIIGKYEGNMEASGYVEIKETGVVKGKIKTDSLIICKGGIFEGSIVRISEDQEKLKKGKASRKKLADEF